MKEIKGIPVLETLEEIAAPKHTALLVIDVQNDSASLKGGRALTGVDISMISETVPRMKRVIDAARQLELMIIFMRNTRSKDGSLESAPLLRGRDKRNIRDIPGAREVAQFEVEGTWGNEIVEDLAPRSDERQVVKYRSSSFIGTPLDFILRNRRIRAAVVVGLVTEGCVETTVRDLEQYGYFPVVLRDCVCSRRQDLHDAALLVMSARYDVVSSEELLKVWRSAGLGKP